MPVRPCKVCKKPSKSSRCHYCARCHPLFKIRNELLAKAATLKERYDPARDVFTCTYCGAVLNLTDRKDPFLYSFDHRTPRKRHDLAVCAILMNRLKTDMTVQEFFPVVRMLARRFLYGEPFDRGAVRFRFWNRKPRPKARMRRPVRVWRADACHICGKPPVPTTLYCARCHRFADQEVFDRFKKEALGEAHDPAADGFRCQVTGELLDIDDRYGPWGLSYDHVKPGRTGRVMVVANFINQMKSQLSLEEFKAVIIELYRHREEGRPFRRDVVKFEFWTGL